MKQILYTTLVVVGLLVVRETNICLTESNKRVESQTRLYNALREYEREKRINKWMDNYTPPPEYDDLKEYEQNESQPNSNIRVINPTYDRVIEVYGLNDVRMYDPNDYPMDEDPLPQNPSYPQPDLP